MEMNKLLLCTRSITPTQPHIQPPVLGTQDARALTRMFLSPCSVTSVSKGLRLAWSSGRGWGGGKGKLELPGEERVERRFGIRNSASEQAGGWLGSEVQPRKAEAAVPGMGPMFSGTLSLGAGEVLGPQGSIWRHRLTLTSSDPGTDTHAHLVVN